MPVSSGLINSVEFEMRQRTKILRLRILRGEIDGKEAKRRLQMDLASVIGEKMNFIERWSKSRRNHIECEDEDTE